MRLKSLNGKLVQMVNAAPRLWWPFVSGWLQRRQNDFVPCVFSNCKRLLQVPLKEFYESYFYFCEHPQGRHEMNYFLDRLKRKEVFYDIGAFHGAYSTIAKLKLQKDISLHVFEPLAKNVQAIRRVCELNGFIDFKINPLAVGDGSPVMGNVNEQDVMLRLGDTNAMTPMIFSSVSLDEYIASGNLAPTIIKIDVEGFELQVLQGGQNCLRQHRPSLWLEVHVEFLAAQKKTANDVLNLLREMGYTISFFNDYNSPAGKISYHVWCE
jgi:FkbM family methyltransferase